MPSERIPVKVSKLLCPASSASRNPGFLIQGTCSHEVHAPQVPRQFAVRHGPPAARNTKLLQAKRVAHLLLPQQQHNHRSRISPIRRTFLSATAGSYLYTSNSSFDDRARLITVRDISERDKAHDLSPRPTTLRFSRRRTLHNCIKTEPPHIRNHGA